MPVSGRSISAKPATARLDNTLGKGIPHSRWADEARHLCRRRLVFLYAASEVGEITNVTPFRTQRTRSQWTART